MTARETATVLAALRYWQSTGAPGPDLADIASVGGTVKPLGLAEIDDLCERLNCEDGKGRI